MPEGLMFECRPIRYGSFADPPASYHTADETDAVEWAKANLTRDLQQITIEVCAPGDVSTFALRHFTHDGDSGWRCWRDRTHVGALSLDRLFELVGTDL